MGLTMNWPGMLTRSGCKVRPRRINAEVRKQRMDKICHLIMTPRLVKRDENGCETERIIPVIKKRRCK